MPPRDSTSQPIPPAARKELTVKQQRDARRAEKVAALKKKQTAEKRNRTIAISLGAVFMGAMTYIGNGPNFMVKAIAEDRGIKMPSFFGYMLWSGAILLPIFIVMTFIWFR